MDTLAVLLLLLIEDRVLVLGKHLLLTGHFIVPALYRLGGVSVAFQSCGDSVDNAVNATEALSLACLLGGRKTPRDLPIPLTSNISAIGQSCRMVTINRGCGMFGSSVDDAATEERGIATYQRRPEKRGEDGLNIILAIGIGKNDTGPDENE